MLLSRAPARKNCSGLAGGPLFLPGNWREFLLAIVSVGLDFPVNMEPGPIPPAATAAPSLGGACPLHKRSWSARSCKPIGGQPANLDSFQKSARPARRSSDLF